MKNVLKLVLLTVFVVSGTSLMGQQIKLGYINSQELISVMPESDSANVKLQAYSQELQDQIESLQVELNNKFQKYQKELSGYTEAIRSMKEKELNDLSARVQESQQVAQQDLQKMQGDLFTPIFNKADEAIKKVAAANAITVVFDTAQGALLYFDEKTMVNVLPLVKTELKITK